ncbi:MAG: hypothetical protein BWY15_00423 [Firmicutes bacterium ADurb.Bin193]|nr:MAG: hypothetical protein BWY15_00423 [Firmicutes bacterium ADurb.Bin193]
MNVNNTMGLQDRMSPVLRQIIGTMNTAITVMERLDAGTDRVGKTDWSKLRSEVSYANRQLEEMENQIKQVNSAGNNAKSGFGGWAVGITGINQALQLTRSIAQGVAGVMRKNDTFTLVNARLSLINDGLRTQKQLQDDIYAAADRSRAKYEDIANLVSKVSMNAPGVFKDNSQAIRFAETYNKMLKVSGAESSEASSATLQLTQALSSGRLQGDELRSITENAPMLKNLIADVMGVGVGQLKQLGAEGKITSDIIVKAMENGTENIEAMFVNIPMTFGDRMTAIGNTVGRLLSKVANSGAFDAINQKLQQFHMWLSSPAGEQTVIFIASTFAFLANTIGFVVSGVGWFINFLTQTPGLLETIAYLIGVVGIAVGISMLPKLWACVVAIWGKVTATWAQVVASWAEKRAVDATTVSIWAQAAAWLAVNWPILLVVAIVVGLLVLILKFPEVLGFIVAIFTTAFGVIYNIIASIYNYWASFAEFFANVFNHPVYSIKRLFVNLANTVLDLIKSIAQAIDNVFGTQLASGITSLQGRMESWIGEMPEDYRVVARMEMKDLANEAKWGYNMGTGAAIAMRNGLEGLKNNLFGLQEKNNQDPNIKGGKLDKVGKIDGDVNIAKEDLKYLLDASTRQFVNQIEVSQVVPVDVNIKFGDVKETADVYKIADALKRIIAEQAAGATVSSYT